MSCACASNRPGRARRLPGSEDFLPQMEEDFRPFLLRELVAVEITGRRAKGEEPTAEEYRKRFPGLSASLDDLFAPPLSGFARFHRIPGQTSTPSSEPMPLLRGYTWSERQLGEGGMAVVWRARDERLHRDVAIKVLHSALVGHPAMVRRFEEEAQLTGQLQHPCIPPVHEMGTLGDGRPYFCMKVVKGRTLGELLRERGSPVGGSAAVPASLRTGVPGDGLCPQQGRNSPGPEAVERDGGSVWRGAGDGLGFGQGAVAARRQSAARARSVGGPGERGGDRPGRGWGQRHAGRFGARNVRVHASGAGVGGSGSGGSAERRVWFGRDSV